MKFLKGLVLSLLSLILFFSLSLYGLVFMLDRTLMEPEFVSAEVDKLDIAQFFREIVSSEVPPGQQTSIDPALINKALFAAIAKSEPQLKEQAKTAIYSGYDYFLGKNDSLDIAISPEPVKASIKSSLLQELQKSPPQQLAGLSPAAVEQYVNQLCDELFKQLPSLQVSENQLSPETLSLLRDIRRYISYYKILPMALIGFMILLVLGIILIEGNIKRTTRSLGISLLFYGGIGYAIDFITERFGTSYLTVPGLPPSLQRWFTEVIEDVLAPIQLFSIAVLAVGAILFITSFLIREQTTET